VTAGIKVLKQNKESSTVLKLNLTASHKT